MYYNTSKHNRCKLISNENIYFTFNQLNFSLYFTFLSTWLKNGINTHYYTYLGKETFILIFIIIIIMNCQINHVYGQFVDV